MSLRVDEIVGRRRLLVARIAEQRRVLMEQSAAVRKSLAITDLAWRGYRLLKARPVAIAIVAVALAAVGPGKLMRAGYRGGMIVMAALRVINIFRAPR